MSIKNYFLGFVLKYSIEILLLVAFFTYVIVWSDITLIRLYTLNALWADLGLAMERSWLVYNNNWNIDGYIFVLFNSGILYFTFPISIPHNFQLLLIFQTIVIGGACFPIFGIAKHFINNKIYSLIISLTYLMYFPISGLNWYDFHYQALFPILFLSGYYFFIIDKLKASFFILFLSGTVRFPYFIFGFLFGLIVLLQCYSFWRNKSNFSFKKINYAVGLVIVSTIFLLGAFLFNGEYSYVNSTVGYNSENPIFSNLYTGMKTFLLVFFPFAFLPFLSKRWFIFYLPYLGFVTIIGGYAVDIPNAFHYQYTAMITPFTFLGLIDVLNQYLSMKNKPKKIISRYFRFAMSKTKILILTVVILSTISATLFEPYSPINKYTFDNFSNFGNYSPGSPNAYNYLNQVMSYIPQNNASVITQFNLPEIYPRAQIIPSFPNQIFVLVGGHSALSSFNNLTLWAVEHNQYNITVEEHHTCTNISIHIYYLLAYSKSPWYYNDYPDSMQNFIYLMNESKEYGIVVNYHGFYLLQWKYYGPVLLNDPN